MAAQIRLQAREVSDRFPTLGFSLHADQPLDAEVVLASDPSLFRPENRGSRNAANFYSSREAGLTHIRAGDSRFVVPARVLARFVGTDRLYFALAAARGDEAQSQIEAPPRSNHPFVSLRRLTGPTSTKPPT